MLFEPVITFDIIRLNQLFVFSKIVNLYKQILLEVHNWLNHPQERSKSFFIKIVHCFSFNIFLRYNSSEYILKFRIKNLFTKLKDQLGIFVKASCLNEEIDQFVLLLLQGNSKRSLAIFWNCKQVCIVFDHHFSYS